MLWLKRLVILLAVGVIGFLAWSWFAGPLRAKRDIAEFAQMMESCTPFDQPYKTLIGGYDMHRAVKGPEEGACRVTMSTTSPKILSCAFASSDMPDLAASFARQADAIGFFGSTSIQIDTNSTDPLTTAMNSPACALVDP